MSPRPILPTVRFGGSVIREWFGALAWATAAMFVVAAFADETRNNCGSGGPNGALLVAGAVTAGLASALYALRRRNRWRALLFGLAAGAAVGIVLFVVASLAWVHNCAN